MTDFKADLGSLLSCQRKNDSDTLSFWFLFKWIKLCPNESLKVAQYVLVSLSWELVKFKNNFSLQDNIFVAHKNLNVFIISPLQSPDFASTRLFWNRITMKTTLNLISLLIWDLFNIYIFYKLLLLQNIIALFVLILLMHTCFRFRWKYKK